MDEQQNPVEVIEPVIESGTDNPEAVNAAEPQEPAPDLREIKLTLEAALLSASEPLQTTDLRKLFENRVNVDTLRILLEEIRSEWAERSVELTLVANGWRFRVKPEYQKYIERLNPEKPPKYSRAVLETLAIIAYRQPVTRGDIEDIRGVTVSPGILKALEERGWIDSIGHKDVPGRPALFATTKRFLDDLNLRSLEELPPLHELQATLDMSALTENYSTSVPEAEQSTSLPLDDTAESGSADPQSAVSADESPAAAEPPPQDTP